MIYVLWMRKNHSWSSRNFPTHIVTFEKEMTLLAAKKNPEAEFIISLSDPERDQLRMVLNHGGMGLNDFMVETQSPSEAIAQLRIGLLAFTTHEQKIVATALELIM